MRQDRDCLQPIQIVIQYLLLTFQINTVTNVIFASGGDGPIAIAFDEAGQRVFTANEFSDSVSIIERPTVAKICQDSGFDTGDIRTFVSAQQTLEQITCVNFVGECSGNIQGGEANECTVQDYAVKINDMPTGINVALYFNPPWEPVNRVKKSIS